MFKTKEELVEERDKTVCDSLTMVAYTNGVYKAFNSFAERVEFYKKYRMPNYLDTWRSYQFIVDMQKKHKDIFDLWHSQKDKDWNEWLFDYCFKDVIK